jgi:polysaccharide pyruvyl transferase WcaK-like protein
VFWRAVDEARYRAYLNAMVAFTEEILRDGHRVVLYATTQWADKVPAEDLLAELRERVPAELVARVSLPEVHTLDDLWAVLADVDWVVASRYHGVATALLMRKPVVGIAYEQKTADLMGTLGLREYSIPIDQIDGPSLYALLGRLRANDATIREALDAGARRDRAAVHAQYEAVLASYSPNRVEA